MKQITLNDIEAALGGRGARRRIAAHFGISEQAVGRWFQAGRIPEKRCLGVAEITGYTADQVLRARGDSETEAAAA